MGLDYAAELLALFRREIVLDMAAIGSRFPGRSRISLVRDLKRANAITSYNHSGKHYSLMELAQFDSQGIWRCKGAMFSARGNLKSTIRGMVGDSIRGMTHSELRAVLSLRVHDTLRAMVGERQIAREQIYDMFVYVSADPQAGRRQIESRAASARLSDATDPDPALVIEALSYVIRHPRATADELYRRFKDVGVSQSGIEAVYARYVQGKKN